MAESRFTTLVLEQYNKSFPKDWLNGSSWEEKSGKKKLLAEGITKNANFKDLLTENYAKLIISGDFLINETKDLDELSKKVTESIEDFIPEDKSLKTQLTMAFQSMLSDAKEITHLTKSHINQICKRFTNCSKVASYDFVPYSEADFSKHAEISFIEFVIDVCQAEYVFSFDNSYIKHLLILMQCAKDLMKEEYTSGYKNNILKALLTKIELLLGKLSVFSKNNEITYNFDFEPGTIRLEDPNKYPEKDFRSLFLLYLDPERIDGNTIMRWQKDSHLKDVKMWQIAFLMRYYTKCTKDLQQVNSILAIAEKQHRDYLAKSDHNVVNDYSDRTFMNYVYNSRFSFLCQNSDSYSFKAMKNDLEKIKTIQNETFIYNYHPYQKAIEFTITWIDKKLKANDFREDLSLMLKDLKEFFDRFKQNIEWCQSNQPYLMQYRYKFSCIDIDGTDLKCFCPSSFCRPLRFKELQEKVRQYAGKLSILEYEVEHIDDKKELISAKKKVENMERRNMETMGLFITVTTFLVGLLSIFIGNNGTVSIFEKMNYVITLGTILLMFVCVGYFIVGDYLKKYKPAIFGALAFALLFILGFYFFRSYNNSSDIENETGAPEKTTIEIKYDQQNPLIIKQADPNR